MPAFSAVEMAHAEKVLEKVRSEWLQRPGVTAVDLGFEWSHGVMTGRLAIRVHVAQKKPIAELSDEELFPKEVEGVPVDVLEATYGIQFVPEGEFQVESAADGRDQRFESIPLGVSVGSPHVTAGTLGAKVLDLDNGQEMILSNWHVLVGNPQAGLDLPIWQPGPIDGGDESCVMAQLSRWVLGPYDAAVARLTTARMVQSITLDGSMIEDATTPRLGMLVWKSGRTTGRTEGFIDGVKMSVPLAYQAAGTHILREVFRVIPRFGTSNVEISLGGDSGSVWVDEASGHAVGLHFAGEVGNAPEYALAHEITPVLERLHVCFPAQKPAEPEPPEDVEQPAPAPSFWQTIWRYLRHLFGRLWR